MHSSTMPWANPRSWPVLSCSGSPWDGTLVHRVPSSQSRGFLLSHLLGSLDCADVSGQHESPPHLPGIFCLIRDISGSVPFSLPCGLACGGFLFLGWGLVSCLDRKANGFLLSTGPERLTGRTCRGHTAEDSISRVPGEGAITDG